MSYYAGYSGVYREPYANDTVYGDTVYTMSDANHQELVLILLTPGAYREAFRIASGISYQKINILVPSMDVLFISDVFRLVVDLMKLKKSVKWYYPEKVTTTPTNVLFEMAQITGNYYVSAIDQVAFEFKLSNDKDSGHRFYDIYMYSESELKVFCMYMDAEKLTSLMTDKDGFDEVHISYNATFYGGLTCRECGCLNKYWMPKLVPNNFGCREEYLEVLSSDFKRPYRVE